MRIYADFLKILLDKLVALLVLIVFSPVILLLLLLIWLDFRENPLFLQPRIGKNCKIFNIFKFKKMRPGNLPEGQRLTKLGRFIRRSSLDELPQFANILLGQMSLIGPRPLLARYQPYYTPLERLRHCLRPGLTGWAQVHGRVTLDWKTRFEYDLYYVQNISLWLDLKIAFLTVKSVIASFINPVDNPPALVKRFDQARGFVRLPNASDAQDKLLSWLKQNSSLEPQYLQQLVSVNYFDGKQHEDFLLLSDPQGSYYCFAVFRSAPVLQMLEFFCPNPQEQEQEKARFLELGKLYAEHFRRIASINLRECECVQS